MNKTVNINIGGLFFHIDEDAFQKLSRYFDAIKRSLSNSSGKDEIMKDIEMRVAELFTERQKSDKHVINTKDVDEVVTVMGQPEDYRIDDDASESTATNFNSKNKLKKLYRDKERGSIAGVCTGLGYYFGIDATWIKIAFLATAFAGFGFGIVVYVILWIATPEAITTSEKLEMRGEAVTISNIEKKVREEFESVSEKFRNVNYDELGNKVKSTAGSAGSKIGDVFISIFGAFAKVLGALILVVSSISLFGICVASIVLMFSSSLPQNTIINHISTPIGLETPLWLQGILFLFAFGIPFFFLLILGLKLLVTNLKSIGNIAKYSLLGVWIIAVGILVSLGISEFTQISSEAKDVKKEVISIAPTDTLFVKFKNNDFYSKNNNHHTDFRLTQDENNKEIIYSNNVTIEILKTDETLPYIQVERWAYGKSPDEAKKRAEKIKYGYKVLGNQLLLDDYLLTEFGNKFRNQHVELYLYLPKGTLFKLDENVQNYDNSDNSFFNLHYTSGDYIYKVGDSQVKCLNCPKSENEYNDVEGVDNDSIDTEDVSVINENDSIKTVSVKINGKEVIQTTTGKPGSLTIKDGVIVKNK
ncbi:PspC domain-containing protein [Flavobacterium sp. SUN052]|uniref:PspC domain-containing protein n=1 Tax=Flavobacterium sp. SUN052 TaxID=3002441 RepID=UPI00237E825A|nr:PspC domain-containing protein [Flavobacterium sp. SUN052]MEC4003964.1 PspC domain-containing protein [Flavobacterium sp. SUN052]